MKETNTPIIKYIPLQQGLRQARPCYAILVIIIIKYIPLQQGLRLHSCKVLNC